MKIEEIKTGQVILLQGIEEDDKHIKRKTYQRWKVKSIHRNLILCERRVKLGMIRESFTWQQLLESLIRVE